MFSLINNYNLKRTKHERKTPCGKDRKHFIDNENDEEFTKLYMYVM